MPASASGMKAITRQESAASNASSSQGSSSAMPCAYVGARVALGAGGDELLGRIDRGDVRGADPAGQLGGEPAGAAADVEDAHPLPHSDPSASSRASGTV